MKFKSRLDRPAAASPAAGRSRGKPSWLAEWLENKGQYVRLSCKHLEDLKYGNLLLIIRWAPDKRRTVWCDKCGDFAEVVASITFHEYKGLPPAVHTEEPLF